MRFREPGEEFELEKTEGTSLKTKIRIATLFFCFLGITFIIAKNNFSFAFGKEENIEPICGPANTRQPNDDAEYSLEKSHRALETNEKYFKNLPGYIKGEALELPVGYKGSSKPVLRLNFNENNVEHNKIPKEICGFEVEVYYK